MKSIASSILLILACHPSGVSAAEPVSTPAILQKALSAAQSIPMPQTRISQFIAVAKAQAAAGDRSAAQATLSLARVQARSAFGPSDESRWNSIVAAELKAGNPDVAVSIAAQLSSPLERAQAFECIGVAQAAAGDAAGAASSFQHAAEK